MDEGKLYRKNGWEAKHSAKDDLKSFGVEIPLMRQRGYKSRGGLKGSWLPGLWVQLAESLLSTSLHVQLLTRFLCIPHKPSSLYLLFTPAIHETPQVSCPPPCQAQLLPVTLPGHQSLQLFTVCQHFHFGFVTRFMASFQTCETSPGLTHPWMGRRAADREKRASPSPLGQSSDIWQSQECIVQQSCDCRASWCHTLSCCHKLKGCSGKLDSVEMGVVMPWDGKSPQSSPRPSSEKCHRILNDDLSFKN